MFASTRPPAEYCPSTSPVDDLTDSAMVCGAVLLLFILPLL